MIENVNVFKTNLGDKEITVEVGKLAKQANCAVTVQCGGTMVLVAATASRNPREGIDFFPLLVDVEQKMYSIGKIPGSFMRREGRASDSAILNSRLIDRGIRPLFPEGYRNDVQVTVTVLSSDQENQPDVLGILGAGIALTLSDIPFEGPFAGVRVGRVNGKFVLNPTYQDIESSDIDLVVAGTRDAIMMVEAGMSEVPEAEVLDALEFAHNAVIKLVEFTEKMAKKVGKVDILLNAAGFVHHGTALECSDADWDFSFDLNVKSMHRTTRAFLPAMLEGGGGSIVNISSAAGVFKAAPNRYAYRATKAAVAALTRAVAVDFITKGIRCNCICPGTIETPSMLGRAAAAGPGGREMFVARQPMGRLGTAEEIASLAVYLASDESSFTTGVAHIIDGGWTL